MPVSELRKLVLKLARSKKEVHDLINYGYLEKEEAGQELYDQTIEKVDHHLVQISSHGPIQKSIARVIGKSVKEINYYSKITGNKIKEADLLNYLLNEVFNKYADHLGSRKTVFDTKLGVTTKRLMNLVHKLHEDLLMDYQEDLNNYLDILHEHSDHLDSIHSLPRSV